jgi:hypothetical protein
MPMFKKNLKLIATAIGLVAVLVMGLAMPGATQQNPLARQGITNAVGNALQSFLTAAADVLLAPERALFLSDTGVTVGFIPISEVDEPQVTRLLADILDGKGGSVTIGAIYIVEPIKIKGPDGLEVPLTPGVYRVKVIDRDKVVFVDAEENEVVTVPVEMKKYPLEEFKDKMARGITINTTRVVEKFPSGIEFIRAGMVLSDESPPHAIGNVSLAVAPATGDWCNCAVAIAIIIAAVIALFA